MPDGVLNINKPEGMTSFAVVAGLRKILKVKKIGHGGTLDPQAIGVLPVCLGKATKIVPFLMDNIKEYRATLHLGIATDTQDATGKVLQKTENVFVSREQISSALDAFVGDIEQIPPMFSALRYKGKRLYELARAGVEVERKPRKVKIYRLISQKFVYPYLSFDVSCSRGTYIRTLCADIGRKLGVGGHMASLQRLRVGELTIEEAIPYDTVNSENASKVLTHQLYSMDRMLKALPIVKVTAEAEQKIYHGAPLSADEAVHYPDDFRKGDLFRGHNLQNHLLGIFEALIDSEMICSLNGASFCFKSKRLLAVK